MNKPTENMEWQRSFIKLNLKNGSGLGRSDWARIKNEFCTARIEQPIAGRISNEIIFRMAVFGMWNDLCNRRWGWLQRAIEISRWKVVSFVE